MDLQSKTDHMYVKPFTHIVRYNLLNEQELVLEEVSMFRKKSMTSYAIIVLLVAVLILPGNAIAQTKDNKFTNKEQVERKPVPQQRQIKNHVKPQEGLSSALELSKKIVALEKELSRTKTELFANQEDGDEMYNKINMLTTRMKGLQAVVNKKHTELVELKDAYEKYNDVITCYRTALSAWDNQLRTRVLTGPDRIMIDTKLHSAISKCPLIQVDSRSR
jgi:hypothetical protein